MTSIENLNRTLGNTLLIWCILSIIIGIALYFFSFVLLLQGMGFQAMLWGLINLAIASRLLKRREHSPEKIRRELSISICLDFIYPIIGLPLIFLGQDVYLIGNGFGIIIQGAFLLVLDLVYLRRFNQFS